MLKKNQIIQLEISGMTSKGSGVGRYEDMAVFVPFSAIGDVLKVKILKVCKTHCFGKISEILTPSASRIAEDCPVFSKCGGCTYRHIAYGSELLIKEDKVRDALQRLGKIETDILRIVPSKKSDRYRNKGQYPVAKDSEGNVAVGFYAQNSHRIIPCADCALAPKPFEEILKIVTGFIQKNKISVYNETAHTGLVRHVYLRQAEATGEIMVCLVLNGTVLPESDLLVDELLKKVEGIASVMININMKDTNAVLGEKCVLLFGKPFITDVLCGLEFNMSPLAFYQVNRAQAERLYSLVEEYSGLKGEETVLDLYCGTGTIGLVLAKKAKSLIGVEVERSAVLDAEINAAQNGIGNARFICKDAFLAAEELLREGVRPDVVVLDPPRKGISGELVGLIAGRFVPEKVVYVSCDPATLSRDCRLFEENGYKVIKAAPVDMFPRTPHVETVVLLSHKTPDSHINIKVEFGEGEGKILLDKIAEKAEAYKPKERVTYKMIKEYIEAKYGFKVHTAYIAEVKKDLGLPMYDAPNAAEELKNPRNHPTPVQVNAIKDALKHFNVV